MLKKIKRRDFITRISLTVATTSVLGGCMHRETGEREHRETGEREPEMVVSKFKDELSKNRQMPRDLVMTLLDQKVDQTMQRSHHCAQSSFMAMNTQFGLEGDQVLKALTPLPGIAERGETCGAVIGPLMAFGLIYGRGELQLDDWDNYQESLVPAGKFCERFEKEYGSTMCHDVQKVKFGKCYRLTDPDELKAFQEAGATHHCSEVVRKAVRIAAEIILDDTSIP